MSAPRRMMLRRNFVEHLEQCSAREITEPVVREDIEKRNDLVDVTADEFPNFVGRESMHCGVRLDCAHYLFIGEEQIAHARSFGELEPIDSRATLSHRAKRARFIHCRSTSDGARIGKTKGGLQCSPPCDTSVYPVNRTSVTGYRSPGTRYRKKKGAFRLPLPFIRGS